MRTKGWYLIFVLSLLIAPASACKFSISTANLSSLKIAKDKSASQLTSNFGTSDTVYAVAVVSNSLGAVKVKGSLAVEDVPGQKTGPIPQFETSVDLPGSGTATFTFSPPTAGWPKGKYKVEVFMLNEDGEQKDQKSESFTIS